jgi:arginyl-tRNA synthetase
LQELLDEAKARALKIFKERTADQDQEGLGDQVVSKVQVDESNLEQTAETLGISSIKYFDLKQNRI